MQLPCRRFTARMLMTVGVVGLSACSVPGYNQVEHDNVAIAVSPDGQKVAFSAADGDLYLLELATRRVSGLTRTEVAESSPAFSPDGKAIIYSATVRGRNGSAIFSLALDGTQAKQLTDDPEVSDGDPSFSPDGTLIAFTRAHRNRSYSLGGRIWDHYDVYVMSRDGSTLRRVTSLSYYQAVSPRFVDGGKALVYAAVGDYPDVVSYLFKVPADGSKRPERLTTPPDSGATFVVWASEPSVSPDGVRVAFTSDRAEAYHYDVYVMNADGSQPRSVRATEVSRYNRSPVLLPADKGILFLAATEWNSSSRPIFSLWEVGLDGSKPRRIAESGLFTDPLRGPAPTAATPPAVAQKP